jgi:hypothetical protein
VKVERWEDHDQLVEGQLVADASGKLWLVRQPKPTDGDDRVQTWLCHFSDEYAFVMNAELSGGRRGVYALGDDAPFPLTTVHVVPDESAVVLPPCEVCGFAAWPEGGAHAARSIHMRQHEREGAGGG